MVHGSFIGSSMKDVYMEHIYKESFFNYIDQSSSISAVYFMQNVQLPFEVNEVLDVGCGRGAWLKQWKKQGKIVFGIDGEYVNLNNLMIDPECFSHKDISKSFYLGKKYDLVQCLEVAEHLHEKHADTLIDNLVIHGDYIFFSAATPGQGGEFHVNEQPLEYWIEKFEKKGYICFDFIRPQIIDEKKIEPWYRYNSLLFVNKTKMFNLDKSVKRTIVNKKTELYGIVSPFWRMRNFLLRLLPKSIINILTKIKHYYTNIRNK